MTRVLVVGADVPAVETIHTALAEEGVVVRRVPDVAAVLDELRTGEVDCLVAGPLPDGTSDRLHQHLRREGHAIPVVTLDGTAPEDQVEDVIERVEYRQVDAVRRRRSRVRTVLAEAVAEFDDAGDLASLEEAVCKRLATTELYRAVWIGHWDEARGVVIPAATAGLELESLAAAPADAEGTVAGRAAVDWTPVVEQDPAVSTAAIPLDADGPVGILQVYTEPDTRIDGPELTRLEAFGTRLGSAIAATRNGDTTAEDGLAVMGETLAHELGNQLDAARVQLELARERDDDEHLDHVEGALERIEDLAGEAKALARGDIDPVVQDLEDVAEEAWAAIASDRGTLSTDPGEVEADGPLFQLLLENLFRNAIEHGSQTDPAGDDEAVTVSIGPLDGGFYVSDDGPGIPSDERDEVFEWGYTTGSSSGAGLGIVSLIAGRHGWTIDVTEGEDGGARFEFRP